MIRLALAALLLVACTDDRRSDKPSRAQCERYADRLAQYTFDFGDPEMTAVFRAQVTDRCLAGEAAQLERDCQLGSLIPDDPSCAFDGNKP